MPQAYVTPWVTYVGDGNLTVFAYPFVIGAATDLEVYVDAILTTAYTLTGVGVVGGGHVTFFVAPAVDAVIHLRRNTPLTQETDYIANDAFPAETHEGTLNRLARQIQDLEERVSRCLSLPVTAGTGYRHLRVPLPGAGEVLGWAVDGSGWDLYPASGGVGDVTVLGPAGLVDVSRSPYNADPTGSTDAAATIQAAMDDAAAAGGGTLWFPGTFSIGTTLLVPLGVSLLGLSTSGQAAMGVWPENVYPSTLRWTGASGGTLLTFADHWSHRLESLTLDGNSLAQHLLFLDRSPRGALFRDLLLRRTLSGAGGAGIYLGWPTAALALYPPSLNVFERIFCLEMGAKALLLDGSAHNRFVSCAFTATLDGTVVISTPDNGSVPQDGNDDNCFYGCYVFAGVDCYAVINNFTGSPTGGFLNNWTDCAFVGDTGSVMVYAANNAWDSYYTRCYLYSGTPYLIATGGRVVLRDCLFATTSGRLPMFTITVTASPFIYTNDTPLTVEVNIWGGVVTAIAVGRDSSFADVAGTLGSNASKTIRLEPGDQVQVTYTDTDAPFMNAVPY